MGIHTLYQSQLLDLDTKTKAHLDRSSTCIANMARHSSWGFFGWTRSSRSGLHWLGYILGLMWSPTPSKQSRTWLSCISRSFRTMDWCKEGWRPESVKKWNRKQWNIWKYDEIWWSTWNHSLSTPFCCCSDCWLQGAPSCFLGVALGTRQPCRRSMTWTIWDPLMSWAKAREIVCVRPLSSMVIIDPDVSWLVMMYHLCHHASFITTFHDLSSCIITCHLSSLDFALNVLRSLNVERWWHETIFSGIWLNHHRDAKSLRLQVELELNQTCVSSSVSHLFHWKFPEPQSWPPTLRAGLHRRSLPDHVWSSEKAQFPRASCYAAYTSYYYLIFDTTHSQS